MNKNISFLIIVVVCFFGCYNQNRNKQLTDKKIYFDYEECVENFDIGELTDTTFQIIPLETTDVCPIANIDKIEIRNNLIFIMDILAQSVYVFDMTGKYLNKINAIGQGTGEYSHLSYMTVTDSSIIVIDHFMGKQIEYDISSLQTLKDERIFDSIWCVELFSMNGNIYYVNNGSDSKLGKFLLFKKNGLNEIDKYLPFETESLSMGIDGPVYGINENEASVIYSGDDIIYRIDKQGEMYPEYEIKFKNKRVVYVSDPVSDYYNSPPGYIDGINAIHESSKYLFFDVGVTVVNNKPIGTGNYSRYTCIYNKLNYKTIIYPWYRTFNGNFDSDFIFSVNRIIDNKLITWYSSSVLLYNYKDVYSKKTYKNKEYENRLRNVTAELKDDDNPVLFIYNLKQY